MKRTTASIIFLLGVVILSGCQRWEAIGPSETATETVSSSPEETEVSTTLEEVSDLDQLSQELEREINLEELERLVE